MKYPQFAEILEDRLFEQSRTRSWLAERLKMSPATVTHWCTGSTRPNSPELVIRIADLLGIYDEKGREALLASVGYVYRSTGESTAQENNNEPASGTQTHFHGSVTGQIHTGSGDIHVGVFNAGQPSMRESLLQALRNFRDEVIHARQGGLSVSNAQQALEIVDLSILELHQSAPNFGNLATSLANLKGEMADDWGDNLTSKELTNELDIAIKLAGQLKNQ